MNLNKELDFLSTQINYTCTMLKYGDYGKNTGLGSLGNTMAGFNPLLTLSPTPQYNSFKQLPPFIPAMNT